MKDSEIIRITCPSPELDLEERQQELLRQLEAWINSKKLKKLIQYYNVEIPEDLDFKQKVNWLNDFANQNWDYRKNVGERWNIKPQDFSDELKELIKEASYELGLRTIDEPISDFNYILPLGGARLSNYDRPLLAKEIIDKNVLEEGKIVGLSGMRPINEIEIPYLQEYAPDAKTEFEALSSGIIKSFSPSTTEFKEETEIKENPNLSWNVREYKDKYNNFPLYSLAAPSSVEDRRANSIDTFNFFLKHFNISKGATRF